MKYITRLALLVVVVALGFWVWGILFPNPEKAIRKRLNKLAEVGSFAAKEGNIARVVSVEKLGGFFADKIELVLNMPGIDSRDIHTREELKQAVLGVRGALSSVHAELVDMTIEVAPGRQSAIVNVTLNATVNGEKNALVKELKFNLKKIEGDWLITRVQNIETLR